MHSASFFICVTTALLGLSYAENKQRNVLENSDIKSHRKPKISSEFGYNILNSDRLSNHFRQEHRDVNGVVRGSYGFKSPNGLFRLVQYVADNRGFRAHISSNEQGIGKQNPAGVSINRFDQQPLLTEEKTRIPISHLRKQISLHDDIKANTGNNLPRYDFYTPVQNRESNRNQHGVSVFEDGNNGYEYDIGRQEFYSSLRQNPIDKFMRRRFNIANKIVSNSPEIDRYSALRQSHLWDSNPFITKPSDQLHTEDYNIRTFYNPLSVPSVFSNNNELKISSQTQKKNFKETFLNNPDYLSNLYARPHQEVHRSLPDCHSVSSAVLCKPPLHIGETLQENHHSENDDLLYDIRQTQAAQDDESYSDKSPHSEIAHELTKNVYPPHLVPNSYPIRSEIYKKFFSHLNEPIQSKIEDKNCQKNVFTDGKVPDDYITSLESHRFSDSASANDLSSYNFNTQDSSYNQNLEQTSQYSALQNELYARLIRIIQNDESLNKLKNLILQSNHSPTKTTSKTESPKMSLLGVLILPSNIIRELDYDREKKSQTRYSSADFNEKNLSENSFDSDIPDETQYFGNVNKTFPSVQYEENHEYKNNISLEEDQRQTNDTNTSLLDLALQVALSKSNLSQNFDYNSSSIQLPAETVTSPKLYVYDEQSFLDKEKNVNSNLSSDNWRKILEDEIRKEIRETSLHQDALLDESINSEKHKQPNENQYGFNKHIGPLFDSTGKVIQPENVPIHIHRFNPPSGLTSIPWKFSIPRPAPPRSIVVPPKPPTL